ncbi:hypothetical protein MKW92_048136 [Papaver armeniacum]|nr:hypothetical protein MKW92_048136 [Papaver armeniacum]
MELMIAAGKAVPQLNGTWTGFSISIMKADESILKRLDAPTRAPSWPVGADGVRPPAKIPLPVPPCHARKKDEVLFVHKESNVHGIILEAGIGAAANAIIDFKDSLNEWDGKVGDGDCGSTRCKVAILEDMKSYYPPNDAKKETRNEIASSIRRVMGGTSGIIYDIFCKAAYAKLKENSESVVSPKQCENMLF